MIKIGGLFFFLLLIAGCAANNAGLTVSPDRRQADCLQFYRQLDRITSAHDVEDSGAIRVAGYPYLRSNRFLASFKDHSFSPEEHAQWLELLRRLDEQSRLLEFSNLPPGTAENITDQFQNTASLQRRLQECGHLLVTATLASDSEKKAALAARTSVPDNYQTWQRFVGVYPVARVFAEIGIADLHQKLNSSFQLPVDQIPLAGKLIRYQAKSISKLTKPEVARILQASYQNPLRIPLLHAKQRDRLFSHFAPDWLIDSRNDSDSIGSVTFVGTGHPTIDIANPTVYVKQAYTRYHGENLLQLVYQVWLPAREKTGIFDLYGGELDSVIWRVTLSRDGVPIAYDSMHACGCYYLLFPAQGYRALTSSGDTEPVLAPKQVTIDPFVNRISLRLAARTHYLQQISLARNSLAGKPYRLMNYDRLRSLRLADGRRRNLFGSDGIIDASHRSERFILWPFGVASPGAMRQWGSHAIAFVGRRHFDDPFLLEKLIAPQ